MPVFTFFCHGTNENRAKGKSTELIHFLSEHCGGAEYDNFLILDGPGLGGTDSGSAMPGTFDPFTRAKGAKGQVAYGQTNNNIMDLSGDGWGDTWSENSAVTVAKGLGNAIKSGGVKGKLLGLLSPAIGPLAVPIGAAALQSGKMRGLVYGEGMDDNIRHAMAVLGEKFTEFGSGLTINMIGWSRGAITCIRMANWIQEFYGAGMNINIFAVDPVAGNNLGTELADTYTIPEAVKNFVAILMLNDRRGGFQPQDINRLVFKSTTTSRALLPFPGAHDTPVKFGKSADFPEVAEIVRYMAAKFLAGQGTAFIDGTVVGASAVELAEKYAATKLKSKGYAKMGKASFGKAAQGGIVTRDVGGELHRYISHNTDFFVDEHHVEVFKLAFPTAYQIFFSASTGLPFVRGATLHQLSPTTGVGLTLASLKLTSPSSFALLVSLGVLVVKTAFASSKIQSLLVRPAGLYQGDNGANRTGRALMRTLVG